MLAEEIWNGTEENGIFILLEKSKRKNSIPPPFFFYLFDVSYY